MTFGFKQDMNSCLLRGSPVPVFPPPSDGLQGLKLPWVVVFILLNPSHLASCSMLALHSRPIHLPGLFVSGYPLWIKEPQKDELRISDMVTASALC